MPLTVNVVFPFKSTHDKLFAAAEFVPLPNVPLFTVNVPPAKFIHFPPGAYTYGHWFHRR